MTESDHDYIIDKNLRQYQIEYEININIKDTVDYFCLLIIEAIYCRGIIIQLNIFFIVIIYNALSLVVLEQLF